MKLKYLVLCFLSILAIVNCAEEQKSAISSTKPPTVEENNALFNKYAASSKKHGIAPPDSPVPLKADGQIFFQAWAKYFHYEDKTELDKPGHFFINNEFYAQKVLKKDFLNQDTSGFLNVPTKYHFFITINRDNVNI